jgi:hypothetical protein
VHVEIRRQGDKFEIVDSAGKVRRTLDKLATAQRVVAQFAEIEEPPQKGDQPRKRVAFTAGDCTVEPSGRMWGVFRNGSRFRVVKDQQTAERIATQLGREVVPGEDLPVSALMLAARHISALERLGLTKVSQVDGRTKTQLEAVKGIGPALARAVVAALEHRG